MTEDSLPLAELLAKAGDSDFLRSVAEAVVQLLMETDAEGLIGAGGHERTVERQTYRNGYRDRVSLFLNRDNAFLDEPRGYEVRFSLVGRTGSLTRIMILPRERVLRKENTAFSRTRLS